MLKMDPTAELVDFEDADVEALGRRDWRCSRQTEQSTTKEESRPNTLQ